MRFTFITALAAAAAAVSGVSAVPFASSKPEQIRSDQDPVFHFYLQAHPKNASQVVLGPEATSEYFTIGGSIQSTNTSRYLNIGGDSTSYKTLTLDAAASTTAWQLEGDTIITSTASTYGRQLNFLVCKIDGGFWQVYLQTGSATPSGKTCSNYQSLHLPCLC
ncbi:hypothetical protein HMPREF1624_06866 [Sporothrix schenckii ATCC 58251]|uniref:Uncharacterized protein n=1 Tax=Sporothrix schenckii (strain ATCC 58251 / de Perez 2211183) TaxID=1391915 RepID=U7PM61_SPOS1|nr:hypothetical protein HMPREF1624_06866 [Sporothrix schenckii ATCC 58251]